MNILTVVDLEVCYGQFQALFGVSLTVDAGEKVVIIGANGAGKTTLLRTITGTLKPTQGDVIFRGRSVVGRPAYSLCRRGIVMVPEGRKIFPSLSVQENLMIGAYSGRPGPWDCQAVYELFPNLKRRAKLSGIDLSGGEQQMLAIGRALMNNPEMILMDEISLGLAPLVVEELYRIVDQISQAGTPVILVEQDVSRSLKVADRVYCLLEGKVSLAGRPAELTSEQISRAYFGV